MEGVLSPRESGRLISETAKDVFIDPAGITKVAQLVSLLIDSWFIDIYYMTKCQNVRLQS